MQRTDISTSNRTEWSAVRYDGPIKAHLTLDFNRGYCEASVSVWNDFGWQHIARFSPNFRSDSWKVSNFNPANVHDASDDELNSALEEDLEYLVNFGRDFLAGL